MKERDYNSEKARERQGEQRARRAARRTKGSQEKSRKNNTKRKGIKRRKTTMPKHGRQGGNIGEGEKSQTTLSTKSDNHKSRL